MTDIIQNLAHMAEGRGARSTVLQPLLWMMAVTLMALVGGSMGSSPIWLLILLAALFTLILLIALRVYMSLINTKPELLRSERFHIRKLEIEQAAIGDNLLGTMDQPLKGPLMPEQRKGELDE